MGDGDGEFLLVSGACHWFFVVGWPWRARIGSAVRLDARNQQKFPVDNFRR